MIIMRSLILLFYYMHACIADAPVLFSFALSMIRPSARVVAGGLVRRPDVNGAHGTVVSRRAGDRWAVQLDCTPHPVSVARKNLALAAAESVHAHCAWTNTIYST